MWGGEQQQGSSRISRQLMVSGMRWSDAEALLQQLIRTLTALQTKAMCARMMIACAVTTMSEEQQRAWIFVTKTT